MQHVAIIGNGVAGITAARYIRKLREDYKITVISSESRYFYSRPALMYVFMGHLNTENVKPYEDHFWAANRIELVYDHVSRIDTAGKQLVLKKGAAVNYDILIIATGSRSNMLSWPGIDAKGVQTFYSWQDIELMEENARHTRHAVLAGGGLIGVEMAEMLMTRNISVTFLVREDRFWGNVLPYEEGTLVGNHLQEHHVDLRLNTELQEIVPDEQGRVKKVITKDGQEIACQFVGVSIGVHPNIDVVKDSGIETNKGVLVNAFLETNIPHVYAIGDCAEFEEPPESDRGKVEQVWYTGRKMGETVAKTICRQKTPYKPGIWFNSAKFFDIEYQTYGRVWRQPKDDESFFYWEDHTGKRCLKLVYEKESGILRGINAFGIRLRHEVCEKWLENKYTIDRVLQNFRDANFDPEFYDEIEPAIVDQYNMENNTRIKPHKKSWRRILDLIN